MHFSAGDHEFTLPASINLNLSQLFSFSAAIMQFILALGSFKNGNTKPNCWKKNHLMKNQNLI
jgi:hypothetical protein